MRHPAEQDLALYASGDQGFFKGFTLRRHVRDCAACAEVIEEYREITAALAVESEIPGWDSLAAEMKANIRLGLEAGACIPPDRTSRIPLVLNPRLAVAFASLMVLVGAGVFLRPPRQAAGPATMAASQVTAGENIQVDPEGVTITHVFGE
jgi:hypothetical protein